MGRTIEADYLVVGAGAMGMAFIDTLVNETDAAVVVVDRNDQPGGHWTTAYPYVRLHQPSAYYGVNSRKLGSDAIDQSGVAGRDLTHVTKEARVDRRTLEVGRAHPVDDDLHTVEVTDQVTIERALVEVQLVDQARAPARLDTHAQAQVVATLLLEQALDLGGRHVGEDDTVGGSLGLGRGGLGGGSVRVDTHVQSFTSWSMGLE